jgi:hypothetical protein
MASTQPASATLTGSSWAGPSRPLTSRPRRTPRPRSVRGQSPAGQKRKREHCQRQPGVAAAFASNEPRPGTRGPPFAVCHWLFGTVSIKLTGAPSHRALAGCFCFQTAALGTVIAVIGTVVAIVGISITIRSSLVQLAPACRTHIVDLGRGLFERPFRRRDREDRVGVRR